MVTKKRRRRRLARASAQRQAMRRHERESHRRRLRIIATGLGIAVAVAALVAWIVTHDSATEASAGIGVYYDGGSVVPRAAFSIEGDREQSGA